MRWWKEVDRYVSSRLWPLIPFQPILYFFILGAVVRLWMNQSAPPAFDDVFAQGFYGAWLAMGIVGPLLALLSWWLVRTRAGRWRFLGMWTRFSSDIMVFTVLLSFHVVTIKSVLGVPPSESKIFARYMVGATLIFTLTLIVRDVWVLVVTERLAGRIHRGDCYGEDC